VFWLAILVNRDTGRCNNCVLVGYYLEYSLLIWVVDQSWFPFEMSSDLGSNGLSAVIESVLSPGLGLIPAVLDFDSHGSRVCR
jgi:hypothetical protein